MIKHRKTISTISALACVVIGVVSTAHADGHGKGMNVPFIETTEFMTGLDNPWDMAFLPDGTMFYTEKCKGLSVRTSSGDVNALYGVKDSSGYADAGPTRSLKKIAQSTFILHPPNIMVMAVKRTSENVTGT